MGTKSLPRQRHPSGVPWVHSAFGAGGPRFETQAGNPRFWTLPFPRRYSRNEKGGVGVTVNLKCNRGLFWFMKNNLPVLVQKYTYHVYGLNPRFRHGFEVGKAFFMIDCATCKNKIM